MSPTSEEPRGAPPRIAESPDVWRRRLRRRLAGPVVRARRLGHRHRVLPDFVILGAQKAGTTTLYAQLAEHPAVVPALRKEVHHFDHPPRDLSWYRAFFPTRRRMARAARGSGRAVTGEATPYYLAHPGVPARLHATVPDALLIVLLRDPVARAISAYHHAVRMGVEDRPIEVALDPAAVEVLPEPADLAWYDARDCPLRLHGYLARGRYAEQLERWYEHFDPEQVLVLETTALDSGAARAQCLARLGVQGDGSPAADRNVGTYAPPANDLEANLREYFRPHDERLAVLLGREPGWVR